MKFVIDSTTWGREPEKVLDSYPFLLEYGFEIVEVDENILFGGRKSIAYIYIDSLEKLLRLHEQCEEELVITRDIHTDEKCIEIYDGYRE